MLEGGVIKFGSFNEDACGNWFISVTDEVPDIDRRNDGEDIGIDLRLENLAVLSDG